MHTTFAPAQKTITTRNRSMDCSLLTWRERKTPPIGIRHAMKKMSSKVAFIKLMNARQVECISFELVAVDSVKDLVMSRILRQPCSCFGFDLSPTVHGVSGLGVSSPSVLYIYVTT